MNSRMERYNSKDINEEEVRETRTSSSRVLKNNSLYQDIKSNELSRVRSNDNIKVIENSGNTIDLEKIRKYITEINEQPRSFRKGFNVEFSNKEEEIKEEESTPKDYDLNSVLEKARKTREINYDRERHKKLRDTQYDILSKIDMYEDKEEELVNDLSEEFNTDERTLIDLINTVTIHKGEVNLLEELMGEEGEETTEPIEKEVEKGEMKSELLREEPEEKIEERTLVSDVKKSKPELAQLKDKTMQIDNSFYTNSMSFSKDDFEGFDELEKSVKKSGVMSTVLIIILVIFIAITLVIMANYVFDLGLF